MHNPARLTCPMKQRRTTEDETMILSKDAEKVYDEYIKEEQERMIGKIQKNCIHSAVTNHFSARMRQQARYFSAELSEDLSVLFDRAVNRCEVHEVITVLFGYPFDDLAEVENDNRENEGAK